MSRNEKEPSQLSLAAEALEEELRRFERAAETIRSVSLDSGRNLEKAGKALKTVADLDGRLGEHVQALVQAVAAVRDRQQAQAEAIHARALELQQRTLAYQALLNRYEEVGKAAGALNVDVQQFAADREAATTESAKTALHPRLEQLQQRMGELAAQAEGLSADSDQQEFSDIARQADSLRQQLLSAKNKLGLLFRQ